VLQNTVELYSEGHQNKSLGVEKKLSSYSDENFWYFGNNLRAHSYYPTLRMGAICSIINPNKDNIQVLKNKMSDNDYWEAIITEIKRDPKKINCEEIKRTNKIVEIENQEGIVIKFPLFKVRFSPDIWAEIRCSNTICIKPNYSKIWVGISYDNENSESNISVKDFFDNSEIVADKMKCLLFEKYQSLLIELGLCRRLDYIYSIFIEVIAEPLTEIQLALETCSFRFSKNFSEAIKYNSIKWILNEAYGIDFPCIKEDKAYNSYCETFNGKNDEWIVTKILGKEELIGVCLKQHKNNSTKFRGVVHKSNQKIRNMYTVVFSRDVIRNISPMIRR